ncbi:MAG: MFS transporter [Steroidobacteraceae bacterium]|jgi:MFS family permease|nr:MFS transporter [Steroidobacteraceae bacterium]
MHAPSPPPGSTTADAPEAESASELRADFGPVLASMMGLACSIATLGFTYSIGPFIKPLADEFGWSRQQILGVQPLITLAVVALSAVMGWLADRHGVRRFILASQVLFGIGFFGLAVGLHSLTSFYLLYFLMSVGAGATTSIGFSRLLARRYERQRGLALGIANSGTGLCGFLVPPYLTWAIAEFGWRGGYVALGLLPLCIALPLAWRYLHDDGVPAATRAHPAPSAVAVEPGLTFVQALRGRHFWLMAVGLFSCSGVMTALITNIVPLVQEQGNAASTAALVASGFGIAVIVGRIGVGALVDHYWGPMVGAALMFPAALGVLALAQLHPGPALALGAVFLAGLAAGAEVDLMAYLASRYFGLREFGRIFAALYVAFALGPGLLVPLFGRARDVTGSYDLGLHGVAAGIALFGVLLLALGRYPDFGTPRARG